MKGFLVRDKRGKLLAEYRLGEKGINIEADLKSIFERWQDLNVKRAIKEEFKIQKY